MSRLVYMLAGVLVGGALVFGSLKYHVLRTSEGFSLVPKLSASLEDTYVDIREFGLTDWMSHRSLALAISKANKEHLVKNSVTDHWKSLLAN